MLTKPHVLYDNNLKQALGFQNPFYLKKAQQIRLMLYDGNVITKETNVISITDSEETLLLKEESRSKMLLKQSDPMVLEKKVNTKPINYAEVNRLSKDFGKRFVPQRELFDEQVLHLITDQSASSPVKIKAHQELPKNNTYVNQTEPSFNQLLVLNNLKAELQAKDTTIEKLKANIKHLNKTSTTNNVKKDIDQIETVNIELEHRVTKLIDENEHLKQTYKQLYDLIKPSRLRTKEQTESLVNQLNQKKFKGKDIVNSAALVSNATTIAPGMYKLDPVVLAPKVKNNREAHEYYLKHTMEQAAILRERVEQAYSLYPLDNASYSACNTPKASNRPILSSTGVNPSTSASRSKPSGNTKNDRILQTPSSNEMNKVEVQSRKVKSSLNKRNSESKNVCIEHVKHPIKGANVWLCRELLTSEDNSQVWCSGSGVGRRGAS
ncbi:hypothetical protein Tco_0025669 [Tanacetum coccineum]